MMMMQALGFNGRASQTAGAASDVADAVALPVLVQEGFVDLSEAENPTDVVLLLAKVLQSNGLADWDDEVDINTGYLYLTPAQVKRMAKLLAEAHKPLGVLFTQVPQTQQAALEQGFLVKETPVIRPRRTVKPVAAEPLVHADTLTAMAIAMASDALPLTNADGDNQAVANVDTGLSTLPEVLLPTDKVLESELLEMLEEPVIVGQEEDSSSVTSAGLVPSALEEGELPTRVVRGTLRSGRYVEFAGHLVILGDVNTGAEVRALGDIIVWGELKGLAHAGYKGSRQAQVRALRLDAVQVRIADVIGRRPDRVQNRPGAELLSAKQLTDSAYFPEVARVVGQEIQIFTTNSSSLRGS
jgi:septum formation inhibitor MinC